MTDPIPQEVREKYSYYRPEFVTKADPAEDVQVVEALYDSLREWKKDPKGYFLIKVFYGKGLIGARFCTYDNQPKVDIVGTDSEKIVQTIIREGLVTSLQHAAYLGHELNKAEVALKLGVEFVQCSPLDLNKKTSKKESDNLPE